MVEKTNSRIEIKSIEFNTPPFRKLRDFHIDIAERITLIAGHNGIGKSTILGLLSSVCGLTDNSHKSYFQEPFYTNIERIVYIALDEVELGQENPSAAPVVTASIGQRDLRKRCSLTRRTEWKRARVVPRTINHVDGDCIGPDAKIPLPTIYLGTRRLVSVGEADERDVSSRPGTEMDEADRHLMASFVNSIIIGSDATTDINHHSIKGVRKRSAHPSHKHHDTLAISMGQDSLGSIATALASFNRLKRSMGREYPGGLLIIDELDIGFHPHAIDRLVRALKTSARQLSLQIVATTHSPRMIEALHAEGAGDVRSPDAVWYLVDTQRPRIAEDQSLKAILQDMALEGDATEPNSRKIRQNLCVYFEDQEAIQFCEAFVSSGKRGALTRKYGNPIKFIPLGVGGSSLIKLPEKDPLFKDRVLVVDGDTSLNKKAMRRGNTVKLPCTPQARGTARSPENTVKHFLKRLACEDDGPFYDAMLQLKTTNPSSAKIHNTFFLDGDGTKDDRDSNEKWWKKHWPTLKRWGVLALWRNMYAKEADRFVQELESAIALVTKQLAESAGQDPHLPLK